MIGKDFRRAAQNFGDTAESVRADLLETTAQVRTVAQAGTVAFALISTVAIAALLLAVAALLAAENGRN